MAPLCLCPWPGDGCLAQPTEPSPWTRHRVCSEGSPCAEDPYSQPCPCPCRGLPRISPLPSSPVLEVEGSKRYHLYCVSWRQALAAVNPRAFPCQGPSPPHLQFSAHSRGNSDHMTQGLSSNSVGAPIEKIHLQQHLDLVSLNTRPGWHLSPPPSSLGSLPWPETGANGFSSSPAAPASH